MKAIVFGLPGYEEQAGQVAGLLGAEPGEVERRVFPDGERYQRIVSDVAGRVTILVGGTVDDTATLTLYDLATGMVRCGAESLALVVPYFGYATMDRATRPGEIVAAKNRARLFSSIPIARHGNQIFLLDLHSEGIPYYFEGPMRAVHIYAERLVLQMLRDSGGDDFVLGSVDAGRAKWVQSLALALGVESAFVIKHRQGDRETEVTATSGRVEGRSVVIYDDMIRTGGSLLGAARAYRAAGAVQVHCVATHGAFADGAWESLTSSGLLDSVAVTDSHPRARELASRGLQVASVASTLAAGIEAGAVSG